MRELLSESHFQFLGFARYVSIQIEANLTIQTERVRCLSLNSLNPTCFSIFNPYLAFKTSISRAEISWWSGFARCENLRKWIK